MARNWMVNPRIHCVKHLNGAHVECHIFMEKLRNKKNIKGYIQNNCLEIKNLVRYHDLIAEEMIRRNYNHKTEIGNLPDLTHLDSEDTDSEIDREASLEDLLKRCDECMENYINLVYELSYVFV